MSELTLSEILTITDGVGHKLSKLDSKPTNACYDSRDVTPGSLFAAFKGARVDGHSFAGGAIDKGALVILASRPLDLPSIVVSDVQIALTKLAIANRNKLNIPVLALTGSSGKTTTKDLLIDLLSSKGNLVATSGSRNNELGMPCTIMGANSNTASLVLEMGARHKGNIFELCRIARPNIVGITNIGSAHLGEFGSREAIMQTKGEIVELLNEDNFAVLNADQNESQEIAKRTKAKIWLAGYSIDAEIRVTNLELDNQAQPSFTLTTPFGAIDVQLHLVGAHHANNAAIATGMALRAGISLDQISTALADARPRSGLRMATSEIGGVKVIDDSYNANPESMLVALDALNRLSCAGRKIAVLGEMAELGEHSKKLHHEVGAAAIQSDLLIGIGSWGSEIIAGALAAGMDKNQTKWCANESEAISTLRHELESGDVVLFKASRAAGFDQVAAKVRDFLSEKGN